MAPKCQPSTTLNQETNTVAKEKIRRQASIEKGNKHLERDGRPPLAENYQEDKSWWTWMGSDELGMISPQMLCNRSTKFDKGASSADTYPLFDYAAMHAMMIETLLEEQKPVENFDDTFSPTSSLAGGEEDDFLSPETDSLNISKKSNASGSSKNSFFRAKKQKKQKRKRVRSSIHKPAPILISLPPSESVGRISSFSSVESSLSQSSTSSFLPSAGSFLSPNCKLQKDRGNGYEPGSAITCFGKEASLEKLRAKTAILGQAISRDDKTCAGNDSDTETSMRHRWGVLKPSAKAEMRRGPVKLTKLDPPETRSILEAKMGFLSLKYGILLQWDKKEGLVDLVVMRKMVTGAFMDVEAVDLSKFKRKLVHSQSNPGRNQSNTEAYRFHPSRSLPDIPPSPSDYDGDDSVQTSATNRLENSNNSEVNQIDFSKISVAADAPLLPKKDLSSEKPPLNNSGELSTYDTTRRKATKEKPLTHEKESYTIRSISHGSNGSNAIIEKTSKYEDANFENSTVPILHEPFLVTKPKYFSPSTLTVKVLRARGLMQKRKHVNTYVRLSTKNASHRTGAIRMSKNPVWGDKDHNKCTLSIDEETDDVLKVEICDRRNLLKDRVLSVLYVPLELVEPHKVDTVQPTEITIPCRMLDKAGPYGSITLALVFKSQRRWWMREEIRAREKRSNGETVGENCAQVDWTEDCTSTAYWFCCY